MARAEALSGGPAVVLARDLILLKLYAGGTHDLWDVRELLTVTPESLDAEVSSDVATLSADMQQRWESVRRR